MKWKTWVPVVMALVLGGVAAKLVHDSLKKPREIKVVEKKSCQIVVAVTDLIVGEEIRPQDVMLAPVTSATPPPDTFINLADVVGRVLTSPVLKGQSLLKTILEARGAGGSLATYVPPGFRAMTMNVDEPNSLAGMLLPGCHVDIVATLSAGKESIARTLIKNILVQAVGQRLTTAKPADGKEPGPFRTITIIVTPHDGELIELASSSAKIRLLLRGTSHSDNSELDPGSVTVNDVTGIDKAALIEADTTPAIIPPEEPKKIEDPKPVVVVPQRRTVEIIRGANAVVRQQFDLPSTDAKGVADPNTRPTPNVMDANTHQTEPAVPGLPDEKPEQ